MRHDCNVPSARDILAHSVQVLVAPGEGSQVLPRRVAQRWRCLYGLVAEADERVRLQRRDRRRQGLQELIDPVTVYVCVCFFVCVFLLCVMFHVSHLYIYIYMYLCLHADISQVSVHK